MREENRKILSLLFLFLTMVEERDFRRRKLLGKFTAKMSYGWDDGKFEEEYLKKLERNWRRWKAVSLEEKP